MQKTTSENLSISKPDLTITKRMRNTNYIVNVHYSTTSKEDIRDKVLRLIKTDIAKGA